MLFAALLYVVHARKVYDGPVMKVVQVQEDDTDISAGSEKIRSSSNSL